jgi:hypothetical protein
MITNFRSTIWGRWKDLANAKVVWLCGTTAAVNGTTGKGIAGPGSLYSDIVGKTIRMNTGTILNPTWGILASDPASDVLTAPPVAQVHKPTLTPIKK